MRVQHGIGKVIRELRVLKDWSCLELANKANTTEEHIERIELGDQLPSVLLTKKIADAFDVSSDDLIGKKNEIIDLIGNCTQEIRVEKEKIKIMKLQKISKKHLIAADSDENNIFQKVHSFNIEKTKYSFKYNQLIPFENYEKKLTKDQLAQVIEELDISKNVFGYSSSDDLDLYVYNIDDGIISILAIGEVQPSRYKIILEASYKMTS